MADVECSSLLTGAWDDDDHQWLPMGPVPEVTIHPTADGHEHGTVTTSEHFDGDGHDHGATTGHFDGDGHDHGATTGHFDGDRHDHWTARTPGHGDGGR